MNGAAAAQWPARVMVAKIGLDGHDRGARVVAAALRDAGMEVVYTGPWKTIPQVVATALEEDVDVIGVSSLASDHLLVPELVGALREAGLGHIAVVVGGIVPDPDEAELRAAGVAEVFHPGGSLETMVDAIRDLVRTSRETRAAEWPE